MAQIITYKNYSIKLSYKNKSRILTWPIQRQNTKFKNLK